MARDYIRILPWGTTLPRRALYNVHLDPWLLLGLGTIVAFGLVVLDSAAGENSTILASQAMRIALAAVAMVAAAQLEPRIYLRWTPVMYATGVLLLVVVLVAGATAKGAQRWLDLPGLPRFQPSEMMKLAVPLMIARMLHGGPLPPRFLHLLTALALVALPAGLIAMQPDLGTALLVAAGGLAVVLLAGIRWRLVAAAGALAALAVPILWPFLHDYQKQRVLTLLNPELDPQGASWNIIQSKTAIGSGGFLGKGLHNGTQSQLDFLPESHTDFIIAVIGEELGLVFVTLLLALYLLVVARALFMAVRVPDAFGRLAVGGLTLIFFCYVFVNIAMVSGLLPVVGVPLPLISYGGTSAITLLAGFGIVMSIYTHRSTW